MNGLTLRISSDKKIKPLKKDIAKEDLQFLMSTYCCRDLTSFEELLNAATVEEQVKALKEIFNLVCNADSLTSEIHQVIDVLVYLFLNLKQKSPLLQSFLKFLSTVPPKFSGDVQGCLSKHLYNKFIVKDLSFEGISAYSFILSTCLDNSCLSVSTVSACANLIIDFIKRSLKICHSELMKEKAPIKKLVIINGIHGCIQASISLYQKYPINSEPSLCSLAVDLLCEVELPLDTRAASGILATLISVNIDEKNWIELYCFILQSNNDLAVLSFCFGLLNVLSPVHLEQLISIEGLNKCTLYVLHDTIVSIEERKASESGIVLAATRCMVLVSRCYIKLPQLLGEILDSFLEYVWSHIEHYMDAVRHLATSTLSNIASIGAAHPELKVFETILKSISGMSLERRSKHAAILELVSHVPVEEIISQTPGLLKALFSSALSSPSSNYALNSLEALICQDLKEKSDKVEWFELWVKPLLLTTLSAPLEQLLIAIIKAYPPVLQQITQLGLDNQKNIDVILTCLKIGRKFNLICGNDNSKTWKGLVNFDLLVSCMYHSSDDVRLSCFSLLIETSKSTEEFTSTELNLLKTFFHYNFSTQDAAVRQKILASSKKLLTRLRDSRSSLQRRLIKSNRSEITSESLTYTLDEYKKFLCYLKKTSLDSLFPGSSPSRRSLALGILALMKQLNIYEEYDRKSAEILLSCLLDSYEENKVIAKDLLSSYPPNVLNLMDQEHVRNYIQQTLMLSSSIRPPDSVSAGYYMSLLASFPQITDDQSVPQSTNYFCLNATLAALRNELQRAKQSLLLAASSGPLYGHLFVIRHLLQGLDLVEIGKNPKWCILVKEIIEVAFECNNVVSCVVYNSSPEGHLPMDFTYTGINKEGGPKVTSQMVLLCSWRTVKEVSLLLGELSERASIKENDKNFGLLSEEQILAIGEHLTGLLSETKHRGAFEQAYIGFSKLAGRLWKCYAGKLHELPKKWLDETLKFISVNEKLSATRRSAGIPFIVQGLICSELESGSCKSLHSAMSTLLKIAKEDSSEGRLHALNILRALYRGSSLGEAVGPYVAEGIATAINGFNSNTWAERNSATLLLSALMSRVFGVPRGKYETLSWRNRMTGRLFFQRYPILYIELLSHLEASSKNQLYPALYPVLLLLGRLYPSSLEGTDSNLQLMKYVPFILRCAESSVMKTRSLAAIALASLITLASYETQINELMKNISAIPHENHLHGYLIMVLKLMQQSVILEDLNHEKIKININKWLGNLLTILNAEHSYIVKDACILVVIHFVTNYLDEISLDYIKSIKSILCSFLFNKKTESHYGYEVFLVHSSILLCLLNYKGNNISELEDNITHLLQSEEYDVVGMTSEFLEFVVTDNSNIFSPDTYDCFKLVLDDALARQKCKEAFTRSDAIGKMLAEKILVDNHQEDLVKLLLCFRHFPLAFHKLSEKVNVIEFFYNISQKPHRSVASNAIYCLNSYLCFQENKISLKDSDIECIANLVDTYSLPEGDYECRLAMADLLSKHFYTFLTQSPEESTLSLWVSAIRLALDESADVRNLICIRLVGNVLPSKALELLLEKFVEGTKDNMVKLIGLFYWAVGEPLVVEDIEEGAVFDKGNTNLNYEDLILNRLVCKHMNDLYNTETKTFLESTIDSKMLEWLASKTNCKGDSLLELINNYKTSVDDCSDLNLLLPYRLLENQRILENYKLHNILEALDLS